MSDVQTVVTLAVFASVVLAIAFNVVDLALAALLGVSTLVALGILTGSDLPDVMQTAGGPLALLFGGMVVVRTLSTTGVFERVGSTFLRATRGSGKRFLIGLVVLIAPLCAVLPNATIVLLLAPIIIRVSKALDVDFVGPMVLTAIISNSAGLLTLVGDPATFLVGSSIGMSFGEYLRRVSAGGLLSVLVLVPLLPRVMPEIWRLRRELPADAEKAEPIRSPGFAALALGVLALMVALFLLGDRLPTHILPPAVAIITASLALLLVYGERIEPVDAVFRDIDWKTLVFLACMFGLVRAFTNTGLLQNLALTLHARFGTDLVWVALVLLAGIAGLSSVLANIPVVAVSLLMVKSYFVIAQLAPEEALGRTFDAWPAHTLPVFVAMMFGATLGGNATLIGAAANVVSAGICANHGRPVSFGTFLRYGVPLTVCQLAASALYVVALLNLE